MSAVLADRWWQAAHHAWGVLKTIGGKHRELVLMILVFVFITATAGGFHALSYYALSAFALGFFGALGAGVTKGPEQATEALDLTQAAAFD